MMDTMPPRACSRTARFGSLCGKEGGAGEIDWIAFNNGYHAAYPMTRDELMHEYRHINKERDEDLKAFLAGCGDGELPSLLGEQGAEAVGIDINTSITIPHERCRQLPGVERAREAR
jgi:hypothetical protein